MERAGLVRHSKFGHSTSGVGQQRTRRAEIGMSALPLKADIRRRHRDVSFGPKSDIWQRSKMPLRNRRLASLSGQSAR
jgi:hypothetical protein